MIVGIDATGLHSGGAITHLSELLNATGLELIGESKVVVWGHPKLFSAINERPWLTKILSERPSRSPLYRMYWRNFVLPGEAARNACTILLCPAGNTAGPFRPIVTISQNLLPFELSEAKRFGASLTTFRLLLLRVLQSSAFRRSDGLIFLSNYARETIIAAIGQPAGSVSTIPHGLSRQFFFPPRKQEPIEAFSPSRPFRLIYVSTIDVYKHQWSVVEAVANVRIATDWPIELCLIGPSNPKALKKLRAYMDRHDPTGAWVSYLPEVPHQKLPEYYRNAHAGVFASSCENMPNILLELMGSGLPILCSSSGPMPEVLGESGIYFDPESPRSISQAMQILIGDPGTRERVAASAYRTAGSYSWNQCAADTFDLLDKVSTRACRASNP